jgi:hypothetical protein
LPSCSCGASSRWLLELCGDAEPGDSLSGRTKLLYHRPSARAGLAAPA